MCSTSYSKRPQGRRPQRPVVATDTNADHSPLATHMPKRPLKLPRSFSFNRSYNQSQLRRFLTFGSVVFLFNTNDLERYCSCVLQVLMGFLSVAKCEVSFYVLNTLNFTVESSAFEHKSWLVLKQFSALKHLFVLLPNSQSVCFITDWEKGRVLEVWVILATSESLVISKPSLRISTGIYRYHD